MKAINIIIIVVFVAITIVAVLWSLYFVYLGIESLILRINKVKTAIKKDMAITITVGGLICIAVEILLCVDVVGRNIPQHDEEALLRGKLDIAARHIEYQDSIIQELDSMLLEHVDWSITEGDYPFRREEIKTILK